MVTCLSKTRLGLLELKIGTDDMSERDVVCSMLCKYRRLNMFFWYFLDLVENFDEASKTEVA